MADWSSPQLSATYTVFRQALNDRLVDAALMFDSASTSATNIPSGAKRWNSSASRFEKYTGSAWVELSSLYAINISGNAATATTLTTSPTLSGNVGIGRTASPLYSLDTSGNARIDDTVISSNTVKLSYTGTGNRYSLIDFKSCDTWADYSTRLVRNEGENGSFSLTHRGTGGLYFRTEDGAYISFIIGTAAKANIGPNGLMIEKVSSETVFGGRLSLAKSDITALSGETVIDVAADAVRIFENGGTSRGAQLNLSRCAASAGSSLALLSDFTGYAATADVTAAVANKVSTDQGYSAVGSFCLCALGSTTIQTQNPGTTFSGSVLFPVGITDRSGSVATFTLATALSGTWRLLGYIQTAAISASKCVSLFQRIS